MINRNENNLEVNNIKYVDISEITQRDEYGQTTLHHLINERDLDSLGSIIKSRESEKDKTYLLGIKNKQGNTIFHHMLVNLDVIYRDDYAGLDKDFRRIFSLIPASERYDVLFSRHNNYNQTIFSLLPDNIFQNELISIYNSFKKINSFIQDKFDLPPEKKITYASSPKQCIDNIFQGSQKYRLKFLELAVKNFDQFDPNNWKFIQDVYFLCYSTHSSDIQYNAIAEIINLCSDTQLTLDKESLRKNYPMLLYFLQMQVVNHCLQSDANFYGFKLQLNHLMKSFDTLLNEKEWGSLSYFSLLLSDLLLMYVKDIDKSLLLHLRLVLSNILLGGSKSEVISSYCTILENRYRQNILVNPSSFSTHRKRDGSFRLYDLVETYIYDIHNKLSKLMAEAQFEAFQDKVFNYLTDLSVNDYKDIFSKQNKNKQTIFHLAAKVGRMDAVRHLLLYLPNNQLAANVLNIQDGNGNTILHIILSTVPDKFFDMLGFYPADERFDALFTIKNNLGHCVVAEINLNNDILFNNYLSNIYSGFLKINTVISSRPSWSGFNIKEIFTKIAESNNNDLRSTLKLAIKYYPNYTSKNIALFTELYFILIPTNKDATAIYIDKSLKIMYILDEPLVYPKKSDLNPLLINEIKLQLLVYNHRDDNHFICLAANRKRLIDSLNNHDNNSSNQIKDNIIKLDNLILDLLCNAYFKYASNANDARVDSKHELLTQLKKAYDDCQVDFSAESIKSATLYLFKECHRISQAIEKDHADHHQLTKKLTKSRLAGFIKKILDNHHNFISSENVAPVVVDEFAVYNLSNHEKNQIIKSFEIIYQIFYDHDHSIIKNKFTNQAFKDSTYDDNFIEICLSSDLLVKKAFELAHTHFTHFHSKNYELAFAIYEQLDPKVRTTFSVYYQMVYDIIYAINNHDSVSILSDQNEMIDKCLDTICHIKATALKKSKQITDLTIFDARNDALKSISSSIYDIGDTNLTKTVNRLDLLICNLLMFVATYQSDNFKRIENKTRLFTSLKGAYEACKSEGVITSEKVKTITDTLYDTCITILADVEQDHKKNGHIGKSEFAKQLKKVLTNFDPIRMSVNSKNTKMPTFSSLRTNIFSHDPKPLPDHLLSDDNSSDNNCNTNTSKGRLFDKKRVPKLRETSAEEATRKTLNFSNNYINDSDL